MSSATPTKPHRFVESAPPAVLRECEVLDTLPEEALQNIVRLAAHICQVPIALISLVDGDRQWLKAAVGLDIGETGRDVSFCTQAVEQDGLFVVPDAAEDTRFAANPLVTGKSQIRFYAGAPLRTPEGQALGSLCVIDRQARTLDAAQRDALQSLADMVMTQLELRRTNIRQAALLEEHRRTEGRLRMLEAAVEQANDVILITEAEPVEQPGPRVVYVNPAFTRHTGYAPEEIIGRTPRLLHGPGTTQEMRDYLRARLKAWKPTRVELLNYKKDGTAFWSELSIRPVADATGWYTHWVSVQRDITARKRAEAEAQCVQDELERRVAERTAELRAANDALQGQEAFLRQVIDTAPNLIFAKDWEGRFTLANRAIAQLYGTTPDAMVGRTDADFSPTPAQVGAFLRADRQVIATDREFVIAQEQVTGASGALRWFQTIKTPLGGAGGARQVLGVSTDITERRALEAERERLLAEALERADRDPLTGLLNHRAFHKCLAEDAERAQREGTPLAVVVLDLDNFKFFNDVYGHATGDDVLRRVADAMRQSCRSSDTLARFGGDEFALLMPGVGVEEAAALEARLAGLSYRPADSDVPIPLTVTFGVAVFPAESESRLEVLEMADARLRRAKSGAETGEDTQEVRRRAAQAVVGFPMLDALVTAVDNKDRYTRRHSEDVMTYCLQIARQMGLDEPAQHLVQVAALLHDVGKIGVPDHVLRKPGRLTDAEFEAVKQHPEMGAVMAAAVPGLEETLGAIRHHHERWDGGGYPGGLRGEAIPLLARMMAVADAFSAMTADRPYRQGMAEGRALAILCDGRGTQWDPACVDAFLRARLA